MPLPSRTRPSFYDFFNLCDVFVEPSEAEPWGLLVNEVMYAGRLPVIVTCEMGSANDLTRPDGDAAKKGRRSREIIDHCGYKEDLARLAEALKTTVGQI